MSGYRELDHTADWALRVRAPDLAGLIETALEGMGALMGVSAGEGDSERTIELSAPDAETLLYDALTEALVTIETERVVLEPLEICVNDLQLQARCRVSPVEHQEKEIKAVTFNELNIREIDGGVETVIVFDV